jgi:hypothetical protein
MSQSLLQDIEIRIAQLSPAEKQHLLERLTHDLCRVKSANSGFAATLASMAADPDIQREMKEIDREFADAAEDIVQIPLTVAKTIFP